MPGPNPRSRRALLAGGLGLAGAAAVAGVGAVLHPWPGIAADPRRQAAHLLRRAGFTPAPAEVDAAVKIGLAATVETLLHPEKVDDSALEKRLASDSFDLARIEQLRRWWLVRMSVTRRPLVEKMTLFWHGLLTTSYRTAGKDLALISTQNQFLREHALGNLRDLLIGISKDGAMLHYLDGNGNTKAHANENYARELMELFTMGVGKYTETDVRELARALTGWYVAPGGTVQFRPRAHDAGTKTFLGHTGDIGLEAAIDIILANPATPSHVARKMWEFFVYPNPSAADLKPVVDAYHRSHADIREMMRALLTSPRLQSEQAYRALVKSPVELVAGTARQFGLNLDASVVPALEGMGQALFDPPNVAGWPGGEAWLNSGSWMNRVRWLLALSLRGPGEAGDLAVTAGRAADAITRAARMMVDGNLSSGARTAVLDHLGAAAGTRASADLFFLIASSPEYQLA